MLIKFTKHSKNPQKCFNYLTGEKDHKGEIRKRIDVIRGNFFTDVKLASSLKFEHKYTSAVIAFKNTDKPTKEEIDEVLDKFEKFAFAGLEFDQFTYSAVLHEEEDSCHMHLFIPRCELNSMKSMNINPPSSSNKFESWQDEINIEKNWASPNDLSLEQDLTWGNDLHNKKRTELKMMLYELFKKNIEVGKITNRKTMINFLEESGLSVPKTTQKSITVEINDIKIRLSGKLFRTDFDVSNNAEIESYFYSDENLERCKKNRIKRTNKTADYNTSRYKKKNVIGKRAAPLINDDISFELNKKSREKPELGLQNNIQSGVKSVLMDVELERFKTDINLIEYASRHGFDVVTHKTSSNSICMQNAHSERIIITLKDDNHYCYFNVSNGIGGSIIDFCKEFKDCQNLGYVRKELRGNRPRPDFSFNTMNGAKVKKPKKSSYDENKINDFFDKAKILQEESEYLRSRSLLQSFYNSSRFQNRILTDDYNNIIFPTSQTKTADFSGAEIKNHNFTGQIPSGQKGLWRSNLKKTDNKLVICESAIDCLSYAQLNSDEDTCYISFGGTMNDAQESELRRILGVFKGQVVVATDNDDAGAKFYDFFVSIKEDVVRDMPSGKDWNEDLKECCHVNDDDGLDNDDIRLT